MRILRVERDPIQRPRRLAEIEADPRASRVVGEYREDDRTDRGQRRGGELQVEVDRLIAQRRIVSQHLFG